MMKPVLRRPVVFWLGLFVLVFLAWAWVSSLKVGRSITRDLMLEGSWIPGQSLRERAFYHDGASVNDGRIVLAYTRVTDLQPHVTLHYQRVVQLRFPAGPKWALRGIDEGSSHGDRMKLATVTHYRLDVPMWGVVGCYLLLAAAIIAWRWRRWRRFASVGKEVL
jgi:hypothetical protein